MKTFITALLCLSINTLFADWVKIVPYPQTIVRYILVSGNNIYTASSGGVHRSTDGGSTWQTLNNGLSNSQAIQCTQLLISGSNMYVSTVDGIYKSTDNGSNWVKKSNGIVVGGGALYAFAESIFEINGVLLTGTYTGIYRSTNGAEIWIVTNVFSPATIAKNFTLHNGILYAARETINNPIGFVSNDSGVTWSNLTGLSFFNTITFFSDNTNLFAGTAHGVWLTTNNGASWVERSQGLSPDPYNTSFVRVNQFLITSLEFGGSGIYKSSNNGILWENYGQGLPFLTEIDKLVIFNNKIIAGTSEGLYQRDVSELTGINNISAETPDKFELYQNYPNPFNPETKIKFSIPLLRGVDAEGGRGVLTLLKVYNTLGKEIASLVKEQLQPGTYEVSFDGSKFSSGVYYYSLGAGDYKETRKMILVK